MTFSPFAPSRQSPRRPIDADGRPIDLRPITWNAIIIFGVVPGAAGLLGISGRSHGLARGIWYGVALAAATITLCWLISIRFESRHLGETAEFWLRHEGIVRPRFFAGAIGTAVASVLVLIGGIVSAAPEVSGAAVAPAFVSTSLLVLMWGKVP
jgi:hypothetical protein